MDRKIIPLDAHRAARMETARATYPRPSARPAPRARVEAPARPRPVTGLSIALMVICFAAYWLIEVLVVAPS